MMQKTLEKTMVKSMDVMPLKNGQNDGAISELNQQTVVSNSSERVGSSSSTKRLILRIVIRNQNDYHN